MAFPTTMTGHESATITSTTTVTIGCSGSTNFKWAAVALDGDHTADNFTVDSTGWSALSPSPISENGTRPCTLLVAYTLSSPSTEVVFSWDTGDAGMSGAWDMAGVGSAPTMSTGNSGGDNACDPPNHTWSSTEDTRYVGVAFWDDARRNITGYPLADDNYELDGGGNNTALIGVCSAQATTGSPQNPGTFTNSNVQWAAVTLAFFGESTGAAAGPGPFPRRQNTLVRM